MDAHLLFHGAGQGIVFQAEDTGLGDDSFYLKERFSGLYVHPQGGEAGQNVDLRFHDHRFYRIALKAERVANGVFVLKSRKHPAFYVHPDGGEARDDTKLLFHHGYPGLRIAFRINTL